MEMLKYKLYKRCQRFHSKIKITLRKSSPRPNDSLI